MKHKPESNTHPGRVLVGTASWSDPEFVEHWYPKKIPASERLAWYAEQFEMVEVNSTFYAVPDGRMVERWCRSTPEPFTFDFKLHKLLSRHSTNLKFLPPSIQAKAETDSKGRVKLTPEIEQDMIEEIRKPIEILRSSGKLGVLLLQMSPAFSPKMCRLTELDNLLGALAEYRIAIELRNRNWVEGEQLMATLDFLRAHAISFVMVDAPIEAHFTIIPPQMNQITEPRLAYLRLHGRDAHAYITGKTVASRFNYNYNDTEIGEIAERVRGLVEKAEEVHVVFNNNARDYAPHAATRMRVALGQIIANRPRQAELF